MFLLQNDTNGTYDDGIAYINYFCFSKTGSTWTTYIVLPSIFSGSSAIANGIKWYLNLEDFL